MTFFAIAVPAPIPKTDNVPKVALFLAAIILVMAIAQLFHFEDFVPLVETFGLPGGALVAQLFATSVVVLEIASLPFLLRMRLSKAMRFVSMLSGWLVLTLWMLVQIYLNSVHPEIQNNGLVGSVVEVGVGWWSVFLLCAFGILAAWASWGMWPLARRK
jgi:hypothetical protein